MNPNQYLEFVESIAEFADSMTTARTALVERGWTEHGAEQAALMLMANAGPAK